VSGNGRVHSQAGWRGLPSLGRCPWAVRESGWRRGHRSRPSSARGGSRRGRSRDRRSYGCGQVGDEKADVIFGPVGKQASKQLAAEGLGITERRWPESGQRGRERPDAIVDDLSAPFDQAVGEEQQGRSRLKDHLGLRAGAVGSDAERSIRWRHQRADEAITVNQQRWGMTGIGPAEEPRVGVREPAEPRHDPRRQDGDPLGRHGLVNSGEELRRTCPWGGVGGDSAEQTPQPHHGPGCRGVVAGDISYDECVPLTLDEDVAPVSANPSGLQCADVTRREMDGVRPLRGAPLWPLHALVALVRRVGLRCRAHPEPSSRRGGQEVQCEAFPGAGHGRARLTWRCRVWARDRGVNHSSRARRRRSASRVPPGGSRGTRSEERQVDRVVNVVHAIRGTLGEAGADRPDDDEAVLVTEIRIEQHGGGYPTAGGLLAVGVGAPDGRRGGHDASWGRRAAGGMVAVVTAVRTFVRRCTRRLRGSVVSGPVENRVGRCRRRGFPSAAERWRRRGGCPSRTAAL